MGNNENLRKQKGERWQ